MSAREFFLSAWEWKPGLLVLCAALVAGYGALYRFKSGRNSALFGSGVLLLLLTLASPIHALSDDYLFSAHMVLHLMLLLIVPLLLVASLPEARQPVAEKGLVGRSNRLLTLPLLAWGLGVGSMWFWHHPGLFHAAQEYPRVHEIQLLSLLLGGTVFWWPIIGPQKDRRLAPLPGIVYLFTACIGCTILGIGITFAPAGLYSGYLDGEDHFGIRPLILNSWGLTPSVDQQVGGLLMWVPPCLVYASGVISLVARLYRSPEAEPGLLAHGLKPKEH